MSLRFVKDKFRQESPRLKDVPVVDRTVGEPSEDRGAHGEFGPRNRAATDRGLKQLCREGLEGLDAELARDAMTMYRALVRTSPSAGPGVRQLIAARCRHAVMATSFANAAAKTGLATTAGIKLAEQSRAHDLAAQRLAVTAYDLATREAAARPPVDIAKKLLVEARAASALDDDDDVPPPTVMLPEGDDNAH